VGFPQIAHVAAALMSPTPVIVNKTWTAGTAATRRAISPSIQSISASSAVI
jgi:hypothetical protein